MIAVGTNGLLFPGIGKKLQSRGEIQSKAGRRRRSGNKVTTEAEGAFGSAARPNGAEVDTDWREDRNVQDCQDTFGKIFRLFEFQGDTAETQIEYTGAASA